MLIYGALKFQSSIVTESPGSCSCAGQRPALALPAAGPQSLNDMRLSDSPNAYWRARGVPGILRIGCKEAPLRTISASCVLP